MSVVRAFKRAAKIKEKKNWDTLYILLDIHSTTMRPNWDGQAHEFYPFALAALRAISKNPLFKTIMWTCSKEEDRAIYKKMLEDAGVNIYAVNENPEMDNVLDWGDYSMKMYCNILIDDKAGFDANTEWIDILKWILNYNKINNI